MQRDVNLSAEGTESFFINHVLLKQILEIFILVLRLSSYCTPRSLISRVCWQIEHGQQHNVEK